MYYQRGGHATLMCWALCVWLSVASLDLKQLPSGILLRKVDMKLRSKVWKLVVTVEDNPLDLSTIKETLANSLATRGATNLHFKGVLRHLQHRVEMLERRQAKKMSAKSPPRRVRRGLIDAVGLAAHSLFGVATDEEMDTIREKVQENRDTLKELSTWAAEQIAVVNASYTAISENRHAIQTLTTSLNLGEQIYRIRSALDRAESLLNHQLQIRDDLEDGRLTERILPPHVLQEIPSHPDEVWLPITWYYQWTTTIPLWNSSSFVVELPLVRHETGQGYEVRAFPAPAENRLAQLRASGYAGLDRLAGTVSQPTNCQGAQPIVCNEGPVTAHSCVGALILERDYTVCEVELRKAPQPPRSTIQQVTGSQELVLTSFHNITLVERCPARDEPVTLAMTRGIARVRWQPGCRLEGPGFTVTAPKRQVKRIEWEAPSASLDLGRRVEALAVPPNITIISLRDTVPTIHQRIRWGTDYTNVLWLSALTVYIIILSISIYHPWRCRKEAATSHSQDPEPGTDPPTDQSGTITVDLSQGITTYRP